ncbi:hypothetical protein DID80_00765 [Candidatus Marinamargulisbacteria bacterium SCGC AAA071-K20]|nr:hypothetical protein DID80_00765 [Candidatus Marinamargulisbacteria bacterium SCGC AAA071-K20]
MTNNSRIFLDGKLLDTATKTSNPTNVLIAKNKIVGLGYVPDEDEKTLTQEKIKGSYVFPKPIAMPSEFDDTMLRLSPERGLFACFANINETIDNTYPLITLDKIKESKTQAYGILVTRNLPLNDSSAIAKLANVPLVATINNQNKDLLLSQLLEKNVKAHLLIDNLETEFSAIKAAKKAGVQFTTSLCLSKVTESTQIERSIKEGVIDTISCPKGSEKIWLTSILSRFKDKLDPIEIAMLTSSKLYNSFGLKKWSVSLNNSANFLVIDLNDSHDNYLKYVLVNGIVVK